jgi:hypothetical protein
VALGVGSYFGLRAFSRQAVVEEHCAGTLCDQEGMDADDDAHLAATLSTVGFGVGIAGVGVAAALVLTAPSGDPDRMARLVPAVTATASGLRVRVRW